MKLVSLLLSLLAFTHAVQWKECDDGKRCGAFDWVECHARFAPFYRGADYLSLRAR